ncbi:50S ribosomal protein L9 [Thermodesulfobacteriota bacterium]
MRVILKEDIGDLGKAGDVVDVADGYGRNYLLPKGMVVKATSRNVGVLEHEKRMIEHRRNRLMSDAERLAGKVERVSCTIRRHAGDGDKLFGAVTTIDIEKALVAEGIEVDRKKIQLEEPIKSLGVFTVPIKIHSEVTANLKVWVVKE